MQTSYVDHKQPFFFFFFKELRGGGVGRRGAQVGQEQTGNASRGERKGEGWICVSIKFSLKPNLHSDVQMWSFESPKSEVKRNVQKFHFLTGERKENAVFFLKKKDSSALFKPWIRMLNFHTFHIPKGHLQFLYTSAFWLFSSTFSSSFFSSSDEPFSFSPVFQLPCLCKRNDCDFLLTGYSREKHYKCTTPVPICIMKWSLVKNKK